MIRSSYLPGLSASDWKTQVRKSLEAVSLEPADVLGKYPHQLSGGQLQRLMIARALVLDIQFLVADEIISMLDASTRIDVLNLLGDLKERGVGILFITHDLSLGNYISDKTLIMRHGRIAEWGPTPKVFGNPSHPYTQSLLASVPQLHRKWTTTAAAATLVTTAPIGAVREDGLVEVDEGHFVAIDRGESP
jgi:peptide/nickel transport system ATP-binding protein